MYIDLPGASAELLTLKIFFQDIDTFNQVVLGVDRNSILTLDIQFPRVLEKAPVHLWVGRSTLEDLA